MPNAIFVVKLRVRLRDHLEMPDGRRVVGYVRKHWVAAPSAELALALAAQGATNGTVEAEACEVERAGAVVEIGGEQLRAGGDDASRVLRQTGRILFTDE